MKKKKIVVESLAIRYRPTTLEEMILKKDVKEAVLSMVEQRRFPTAVLLDGAIGCGKTTMGRIIARYIYCKSHDLCGTCYPCQNILDGGNNSLLDEYNMANHRTVASIRELVKLSQLSSFLGGPRVMICDEVHTINKEAAQSWVKPLEEPPPGVMWILATSQPEALPTNILSRCMRIHLEPQPNSRALLRRLITIARAEGAKVTKSKIPFFEELIEKHGGLIRDTITELEWHIPALLNGADVHEMLERL